MEGGEEGKRDSRKMGEGKCKQGNRGWVSRVEGNVEGEGKWKGGNRKRQGSEE